MSERTGSRSRSPDRALGGRGHCNALRVRAAQLRLARTAEGRALAETTLKQEFQGRPELRSLNRVMVELGYPPKFYRESRGRSAPADREPALADRVGAAPQVQSGPSGGDVGSSQGGSEAFGPPCPSVSRSQPMTPPEQLTPLLPAWPRGGRLKGGRLRPCAAAESSMAKDLAVLLARAPSPPRRVAWAGAMRSRADPDVCWDEDGSADEQRRWDRQASCDRCGARGACEGLKLQRRGVRPTFASAKAYCSACWASLGMTSADLAQPRA